MARGRKSKPKKSGGKAGPFGKAVEYALYRTMMDSAGKDPWKRAGVALGSGKTGLGAYYLTKGIQQMNAQLKGKPLPKGSDRIDPYAAAGAAIGLGLVDDTQDLVDLTFELDAVGAFDPPEWEADRAVRRNQYAWRLCCDDGSEYGIDPEDYETRDEYNMALRSAREMAGRAEESDCKESAGCPPVLFQNAEKQPISGKLCKVSLLSSGENTYFLTQDDSIAPGDLVEVVGGEGAKGIVLTVEPLAGIDQPAHINQMKTVMKCEWS